MPPEFILLVLLYLFSMKMNSFEMYQSAFQASFALSWEKKKEREEKHLEYLM